MVKRYDLTMCYFASGAGVPDMEESEHGDYVEHGDYAALAERCERLEELVQSVVRGRSHCFIPTDDPSRPTFNWDERAGSILAEMEKSP